MLIISFKAVRGGSDCIIDSDDDNIPKSGWGFPEFEKEYNCVPDNKGFVNVYKLFAGQKIWPRGLPLNFINDESGLSGKIDKKKCNVGIWQALADEDPDVDAIYRMTCDAPCYFAESSPVVLGEGTICPVNTQNTIIRKELFPLLYLPSFVSFRFTDILRGLIAQPIMWKYGYRTGFVNATVVQKRNPHDYMKDFISEMPMYRYSGKIVDIIAPVISSSNSIEDNLHMAYEELLKNKIVRERELVVLEAWLRDINK